jgi:hypothetical protein
MPVDTPSAEYIAALPWWKRMRDAVGGRDAVLRAASEYLPMLPGNTAGYDAYAKRGSFYNASRRTVEGLTGLVSQKPPTIKDATRLEDILKDVTPRGSVPFQLLVMMTLAEVLEVSRVALLVDMPETPDPAAKPFVVLLKAEDVISTRLERVGSDEIMTRVVIRESREVTDPKDPFLSKCEIRYRVLELVKGVYQATVWTKPEGSDKYVPGETVTPMRREKPLAFIPFVFVGPNGVSPDIARPVLLDLVDLNLAHWRNSVDLEYGLHLVALPTPYRCGAIGKEGESVSIGPSVVWDLEKDGSAGMLEFTGAGLKAIADAMKEKERQMATLGARLLEEQAGAAETATAVGMRHSGQHATLRTIAEAVELALTKVLRWLDWWSVGAATPEESKAVCELNKEFFSVRATPDEVRAAMLLWQGGAITFETLYERLQKGGWTREGITAEEEKAEIEQETPAPLPDLEPPPGVPPVPPPPAPGVPPKPEPKA